MSTFFHKTLQAKKDPWFFAKLQKKIFTSIFVLKMLVLKALVDTSYKIIIIIIIIIISISISISIIIIIIIIISAISLLKTQQKKIINKKTIKMKMTKALCSWNFSQQA